MKFIIDEKNVVIEAEKINIGNNVSFGRNIIIKVRGTFSIGDNSHIGDRFQANGEEIEIGEYFYNNPTDNSGMIIGGGGSNFPFAKLKIGNRCVCHTGQINLSRSVSIGNDVGLSHDVDLITHGFWGSILEGFPAVFDGINIGNNVILGWKAIVMPGVSICNDTVIGAHATVTKSILNNGIYVGTPAKLIRSIKKPFVQDQAIMAEKIIKEFEQLMTYYKVSLSVASAYPMVRVNELTINLNTLEYEGKHDPVSDAFRDFLRRYGIRVFSPQGFVFNLERK